MAKYPVDTAVQIKETSGPTTLPITNVTDGQYLKRSGATVIGDIPAGASDIPMANMAPAGDRTITAGYSAYVVDSYEIAATFMLEIGVNSVFEVG
jgi:hypothetical protein